MQSCTVLKSRNVYKKDLRRRKGEGGLEPDRLGSVGLWGPENVRAFERLISEGAVSVGL
jgi:hypothetical protein